MHVSYSHSIFKFLLLFHMHLPIPPILLLYVSFPITVPDYCSLLDWSLLRPPYGRIGHGAETEWVISALQILHCTALHCKALHYTALHCNAALYSRI